MKSIEEIEKMSPEELDAVSYDGNIPVPEGFRDRLEAHRVLVFLRQEKHRTARLISIAASVAVLAGICLGISGWDDEPEDTFDDPYMAYAELEKAFAVMSEGMRKGFVMAEESETAIDKVISVFEE